jgi:hypothetical protein
MRRVLRGSFLGIDMGEWYVSKFLTWHYALKSLPRLMIDGACVVEG